MKFSYIVNANIPDDWAHSVQIMNMCNAFALNEMEVGLFVPKRKINEKLDPFHFYGIKPVFKITKLPCIDISVGSTSSFLYYLRLFSFYISTFFYFLFNNEDIIYSRDTFAPLFIKNVILERHSFPKNISFLQKIAFRRAKKIVVLTSFLKQRFIDIGIKEENILVSPDAVDIEVFEKSEKIPDRSNFGFSDKDFILGYIGTLKTMGMDKGLTDLFRAMIELPIHFKCLVVGGWGEELEYYQSLVKSLSIGDRVFFVGKVRHDEVSKYIKVCDCLTATFPENEHFSFFMSPLKIFEYMASKKPILATDLPSIREVLTDSSNAVLAKPSNIVSIRESILKIFNNKKLAKEIADKAFFDVSSKYTWQIRARNILDFILHK